GMFVGLWQLLGRAAPAPGAVRPDSRAAAGGDDEALAARHELLAARDMAVIAGVAVVGPLVLGAAGSGYPGPRHPVGALVRLPAPVAVLAASRAAGRAGLALVVAAAIAFFAITLDVNFSPRLHRGDWTGLVRVLRTGAQPRAITAVELGAAPLEYY